MDKYEYKVRADEIKELIAEGEYAQAAEIADTIDWRRVKSVMMLCTISDLYKINRRYEDAQNMLLLAYERRPGGKTICYSLCELYIKTGDFVKAVNYYKEFAQVAPKDSGRYILQYKLYEAQEVSLEERISVLEELKKRDYREKWAYELAYLYHRVGLATRCVEECDELILWFGEGKYVTKAMELKMLHQPLTAAQQEKYEHRFDDWGTCGQAEPAPEEPAEDQTGWYAAPEGQAGDPQQGFAAEALPEEPAGQQGTAPEEMDIQVKMMDVGQYNTINLQAELAAGLKEVLDGEKAQTDVITRSILAPLLDADTKRFDPVKTREAAGNSLGFPTEVMEQSEVFFGETGELSGAEGTSAPVEGTEENFTGEGQLEEEVIRREEEVQPGSREEVTAWPEGPDDQADPQEGEAWPEDPDDQAVPQEGEAWPEGPDDQAVPQKMEAWPEGLDDQAVPQEGEAWPEDPDDQAVPQKMKAWPEGTEDGVRKTIRQAEKGTDDTAEIVMKELQKENRIRGVEQVMTAQPPEKLARVLSQEPDGQLSLVVPEKETVEKQITGQMNIGDVLSEWERMKKENAEKRREEVRQHVREQTGTMFTEFEASVRDGLLEKLESGRTADPQEKDGEDTLEIYEEEFGDYEEEPGTCEEVAGDEEEIPGDYEEITGDYEEEPGDREEVAEDEEEIPGDYEEITGDYEEEPGDYEGEPGTCEEVAGDEEEIPGDYEEITGDYEGEPGNYEEEPGTCEEVAKDEEEITGDYEEEPEVDGQDLETGGAQPEGYEREQENRKEEPEACVEQPEVYEGAAGDDNTQPEASGASAQEKHGKRRSRKAEEDSPGKDRESEYLELQEDGRNARERREVSASAYIELGDSVTEETGEEQPDEAESYEGLRRSGETEQEDWGAEEKDRETDEGEEGEPEIEGQEPETTEQESMNSGKTGSRRAGKSKVGEAGSRKAGKAQNGEEGEGKLPNAEAETGETNAGAPKKTSRQPGRQKRKPVNHTASGSSVEREKARVRAMTREEKELYAPFIQSRAGREKLIKAIDNISMAAYTGNIIITGEEGMDKLTLAKNMIREVQMTDSNFSGKVAKIGGQALNSRNVEEILERLKSGALIVEAASGMEAGTVAALHKALQQEHLGIIVVLEDTKRAMANMLTSYPELKECFTARMDMEAMSNEMLVAYGKQYARDMEYSIDEMGVLALHTRIEELQTIDHAVNTEEVKGIVDEAIRHANRKTPKHFFDILFAKRYDEEDMIILTEKDFV